MRLKHLPLAWTLGLVAAAPLAADEWHWVFRNRTTPECLSGIPPNNYPYPARSLPVMAISQRGELLRRSTTTAEARIRAIDAAAPRVPPATTIPTPRASEELPPGPAAPVSTTPLVLLGGRAAGTGVLPFPAWPSCESPLVLNLLASPAAPQRATIVDLYQLNQAALAINHCAISQVALQLHDDGRWVLSLRADQNRRPAEGDPVAYNPFLHIKRNQFVVQLRCLGAAQNPPAAGDRAAGRPVLADLGPVVFWVENGQPQHVRSGESSPWIQEHFHDVDRVEIEFFYR